MLDRRGEIRHQAGVTPHPGLYVLGLNFQRRRHSSFIDGVAFYQITEKGLMAHADVSGTKFWVNDELR